MKCQNLIFLFCIILLTSCSYSNQSGEAEKIVYDVVFREDLAGTYEKWKVADDRYDFYYTFTDRGRGPEFHEEITVSNENFIINQTIEGNNYLKVAHDESFSTYENTAISKNLMGTSEGTFAGDKLYFRYDGSPAIYEILAQLLLNSENGKVDLYPEGSVQLIKKIPQTLSDGSSFEVLVFKGLDLDPTYLWMKDSEMVCKISGNLHVVRKDLSALRLEMKSLQDRMEDESLLEIAKELSHAVDRAVIQNVSVFTKTGALLPDQDVFVSGTTIESIHPTGTKPINNSVLKIDGGGKTLLPGMFDMHTHNDKFRGLLHIAGGVTSVRDLANNKQLKQLAAQFDSNEIIGPHIVTFCGIIDGPGPYANQRNMIESLEEGLAEIQEYKELGYQQIKLYSSIKPEWVRPLTVKAHELGMRVSGHIPAYMTATQAINEGYNEIQHINMLFLNFLPDTIDTRTPLRFTMPAQYAANLDLNGEAYNDFVQLLLKKSILVDPTIAIFENMFLAQQGKPSPTYQMISDRFPIIEQRGFYAGGITKEESQKERHADSFNKMLTALYDLYMKGVSIVPGTDGLPGFLYHRELELYVKAGIPASEVLKLATIKAAEITGTAGTSGTIEAGKQADLILIDGNPIENIADIRKVELTLKGGNLYYSQELYNSIGIQHFNQ